MRLFAILILVVGLVFLLKNLGLITQDIWSLLWPSLLVVFGIYLLAKR